MSMSPSNEPSLLSWSILGEEENRQHANILETVVNDHDHDDNNGNCHHDNTWNDSFQTPHKSSLPWQSPTATSATATATPTAAAHATMEPVRYIDERTKVLGRKAELEVLRRRNELALKKAAFDTTTSDGSTMGSPMMETSTLASFFRQQQQRRMLATQLRLGALSSLNDYRLRDCDAILTQSHTKTSKTITTRNYSPSAYSKMADIDHFFGVEWRERKKEAWKRMQAFRQYECHAKQHMMMTQQASPNDNQDVTGDFPVDHFNNDTTKDKHVKEEKDDESTTAFLNSLLLVHAELKGFFTTTPMNTEELLASNDNEEEEEENDAFSTLQWACNLQDEPGLEACSTPISTWDPSKLNALYHPPSEDVEEEEEEANAHHTTKEMLSEETVWLAPAEGIQQPSTDQHQQHDVPLLDGDDGGGGDARDCNQVRDSTDQQAASMDHDPSQEESGSQSRGDDSITVTQESIPTVVIDQPQQQQQQQQPQVRPSLRGFDNVPKSSIEDHLRHVLAMQASLSMSRSDLHDTPAVGASLSCPSSSSPPSSPLPPEHDDDLVGTDPDQDLNCHDDNPDDSIPRVVSAPLMDHLLTCGGSVLNFVTDVQTDVAVKDCKSIGTDHPHDTSSRCKMEQLQPMPCLSKAASRTVPTTDDDATISSIGSSIDEPSAAKGHGGGGGGDLLSRASSASSLSSFWRQEFEPHAANMMTPTARTTHGDRSNHHYHSNVVICNSEQYLPNLHSIKGACERCFDLASTEERVKFLATGRHVRIMLVRGGCHRSCTAYPRRKDQPPVRLCRKCYFDCHRAPKK